MADYRAYSNRASDIEENDDVFVEEPKGWQSPQLIVPTIRPRSKSMDQIPMESLNRNGLDDTDRETGFDFRNELTCVRSRRTSILSEPKEEEYKGDSIFSRRMTIAGGFLDIALFSTNCEQLKSLLEIGEHHEYFKFMLGLLILSMILQVAAGFLLFMVGCVTIKSPESKSRAEIMNHLTMGLVALITVVNIFISSFTIKGDFLQKCMRGDFAGVHV